jgi:hypothetical protein
MDRDHMPAHHISAGRQRTLEPDQHNSLGHWRGSKPGQFGAGKKRGRGVQEALMVLRVSGSAFTRRRAFDCFSRKLSPLTPEYGHDG